jgi:hypothetical protein
VGIFRVPDIFGVDYNENLNMDDSVWKGIRERLFAVYGGGKKEAEVSACKEDKKGDEKRKKEEK